MKKKSYLAIILSFILCFSSMPVSAAGVDVTAKMKSNKNVKKIVGDISHLVARELVEGNVKGTKVLSMKNKNLLSMAAYVGGYRQGKFEFSRTDIHKITKDLFGKKPSTKSIPSLKRHGKCYIAKNPEKGKAYVFACLDWGDMEPYYSISSVQKVKKNVYDVYVTNNVRIVDDVDDNGNVIYIRRNIGSSVIRVKKYKKSKYKYIIKKITVTENPGA